MWTALVGMWLNFDRCFPQCSPPHYSSTQPPSLICTHGKCLQTGMDDTEQREKISCICAGLIWVWTKILGQLVSQLWWKGLLDPDLLYHETVILCFKVDSCSATSYFLFFFCFFCSAVFTGTHICLLCFMDLRSTLLVYFDLFLMNSLISDQILSLDWSIGLRSLQFLSSLSVAINTMLMSLPLRGREVMPRSVNIINRSLGQPLSNGVNWVDPTPYAVHSALDPGLSDPSNHDRLFFGRGANQV